MTAKTYTKDDLKKLMEEKKQEQLNNKRIDSPLAKYDQDNNLFCKICDLKIENVNFWTKHLISKEHKLSFERLKKGQNNHLNKNLNKNSNNNLNNNSNANSNASSNSSSNNQQNESKKRKINDEDNLVINKQQKTDQIEEEINDESNNEQTIDKQDDLPKGFFDNPEEDAKARDEIYKDPLDEEYKKFERTMQEENKLAENITEIDLVETQNYRELIEIDEQIEHWNRINELEIQRDAKKMNKKMDVDKRQVDDEEVSSDESDLDEFSILSNWRCKKK